jgi:hypothetical protein
MEDELRLHARAAAALADEAAYLRARLADADDGMNSFASEPHGAPLPARAVAARRVTRTPQISHDGSATTWLSGNEAGERAARARREKGFCT